MASIVCLMGFVGIYLVFVRTARGQIFDAAGRIGPRERNLSLGGHERFLYDRSNWILSSVRSGLLVVIGLAVMLAGLRAGRARLTGAFTVATFLAIGLSRLVRGGLPLRHLTSGEGVTWDAYNTLPSGHTAATLAVALSAVALVRPGRQIWLYATVPYAVLIGVATVIAGWHHPSDVLASNCLVAALVFAVVGICADPADLVSTSGRERRVLAPALGLFGLAVVATAYGLFRAEPRDLIVSLDDGVPIWRFVPLSAGKAFAVFLLDTASMVFLLTVITRIISPERSNRVEVVSAR